MRELCSDNYSECENASGGILNRFLPLDPGLNWTPAAPSTTGKYPPRTGYGLAVVNGGNTIGMTRRGEYHWGVVAGHFRKPLKRVMPFEQFVKLVLPAVEEERMDAFSHAERLEPSYARGYLLECIDGRLDMLRHIEAGLNKWPYERVGFINDCVFKDPLETSEEELNETRAAVVAITDWLKDHPCKALWHKSAAAGHHSPANKSTGATQSRNVCTSETTADASQTKEASK